MVNVVGALIWSNDSFLICRRPKGKARGLLWEFVGGKLENGETPQEALIRECREELGIEIMPTELFCEATHDYPDISINLSVYNAKIISGTPRAVEHCEIKWITPEMIPQHTFCPADKTILEKILLTTNTKASGELQPQTVCLGKTGITVPKNGFGALPVQRVSDEYAIKLLNMAFDNGILFFDTARAYTDSEKKLGLALGDKREKIFIASKTGATTPEGFFSDLEKSLEALGTSYIDIYQFHNPSFCPKPGDGSGLYEAMLKAKSDGKIRHIGITNHRLHVAHEAVDSGLYETLQFPFCYLATEKEHELVEKCRKNNVGFIAMKALSGGLITSSAAAYAYIAEYENVLPIWGIQREAELCEFLSYTLSPPRFDGEIKRQIQKDRKELIGEFCRGCGYCMPCPVGIEINNCARMIQLIRRSPSAGWLTEANQKKMLLIEQCRSCGQCAKKCPYGLDTPSLLQKNLEDYKGILSGKTKI